MTPHRFRPLFAVAAVAALAGAALAGGIPKGTPSVKLVSAAKIYVCPAHPNMTGSLPANGAWISNQQILKMKVHDMQAVPMNGGGTTIICHYIGDTSAGPNWTGVFGVAYSQTVSKTCNVAGDKFVCT